MQTKNIIYFSFVFTLVLALSSFASFRNKRLKINELEIKFTSEESNFLTKDIVNKLLIQKEDSLFYKQKEVLALNYIEDVIESNPYVNTAEVFILPQGKMVVEIDERVPLFRVIGDTTFYVDSEGFQMPTSSQYSPLVPIYYGILNENKMSETIQFVLKIMNDPFLSKEFIHIENQPRGYVLGLRSFSFDVVWGSSSSFNEKLAKLKHICAYVQQHSKSTEFSEINLMFNKQIVAH
jgi:cell division protein FtsQ